MRTLAVAIPLVSAAALVAACSAKKPNPPATPTPPTTDAGVEAAVEAHDAGVAPVEAPPFFTGTTDAGAPPVAAVGEQALDSAIDLLVTMAAPKVAPKMEKEGQPGRATLKEGEHFSMMITLMPNRCYTFVGGSVPGAVSQLDLKLYGPPLFNVEAGKSAPGDKALPVVGKGTTALCPLLPIAVPYKLDAAATKGAGRIGIHVYARNK